MQQIPSLTDGESRQRQLLGVLSSQDHGRGRLGCTRSGGGGEGGGKCGLAEGQTSEKAAHKVLKKMFSGLKSWFSS